VDSLAKTCADLLEAVLQNGRSGASMQLCDRIDCREPHRHSHWHNGYDAMLLALLECTETHSDCSLSVTLLCSTNTAGTGLTRVTGLI
jgi:hypothetical protein